MYVLVDKKSGGVYAVRDDGIDERVVQIFEDQDDAERYHGYLIADDYKRKLEVLEVEEEVVKENCNQFGYNYTVIRPNDIVFPPKDLD
jgi:hypothetical protein|tara:strand:- start:4230 stop:4493 length:264 start_codon:yes stop_codon:yes gene_type:complete